MHSCIAKALQNFDSILLYCAQRFSREVKVENAVTGAFIYPIIMGSFWCFRYCIIIHIKNFNIKI
jgi:type II secretory pathway component PulF